MSLMDFLWVGDIDGNKLVDISGNGNNVDITGKDFSGRIIPSSSSATFRCPNNATFQADDTDELWITAALASRDVTPVELISYDFARTIVYYQNDLPNNIKAIGILKSTVNLTAEQINLLHRNFRLALYWSGVLNAFGYIKSNKGFARVVWT